MKRIYIFGALTVATLLSRPQTAEAQTDDIRIVLQSIETNNKELQSVRQLTAAGKLEALTANNLPDPTLSYAHLWDAATGHETIGELIVSQSFDFPSLYVTRRKLYRQQATGFDQRAALLRQEKLLEAKELCLDIIHLRRLQTLLDERLHNAETLAALYEERLQTGDANAIETNKIRLELLNVRTETRLNATELNNKLRALDVLNGGVPTNFNEQQYPAVALPEDYDALRSELLPADLSLRSLAQESTIARRQLAVNRSQWLPRFELGYRRNTESGLAFNGLVVGVSFPLFENRGKVKQAKAQMMATHLQQEEAQTRTDSELSQLYSEAHSLQESMQEYRKSLSTQQDLQLLQQALTGGQISMIEYFVEVGIIYQSRQNLLQVENQYQKTMARLYKSRL